MDIIPPTMIVETISINLVDFAVCFSVHAYMLRAQFSLPSIATKESIPEKKAPI